MDRSTQATQLTVPRSCLEDGQGGSGSGSAGGRQKGLRLKRSTPKETVLPRAVEKRQGGCRLDEQTGPVSRARDKVGRRKKTVFWEKRTADIKAGTVGTEDGQGWGAAGSLLGRSLPSS